MCDLQVACGRNSTYAVTIDGDAFGWGENGEGQLGLGDAATRYLPCAITRIPRPVLDISANFLHAAAIAIDEDAREKHNGIKILASPLRSDADVILISSSDDVWKWKDGTNWPRDTLTKVIKVYSRLSSRWIIEH